jgi:hypothetical protein
VKQRPRTLLRKVEWLVGWGSAPDSTSQVTRKVADLVPCRRQRTKPRSRVERFELLDVLRIHTSKVTINHGSFFAPWFLTFEYEEMLWQDCPTTGRLFSNWTNWRGIGRRLRARALFLKEVPLKSPGQRGDRHCYRTGRWYAGIFSGKGQRLSRGSREPA